MRKLNLNLLKTFYEVVIHNSFSIAANNLYISKSVVSRHVKSLEETLGCTLIQRTTRTINLTDEGRHLYNNCLVIFSSVNDCYDYINYRKDNVIGKFKIKIPSVLENDSFITQKIIELSLAYPKLNLEIMYDNVIGDLVEEECDLALFIGRPDNSSYKCKKIKSMRTYIVASPEYIKSHGRPLHPNDLMKHRCMNYSHCLTKNKWTFLDENNEITDAVSPYIDSYIISQSEYLLSDFALNGLGITAMLDILAEPHIKNGKLLSLLSDFTWETSLYAIFPDNVTTPLRTRKFIDLLSNKTSFPTNKYRSQ